MPGEDLKITIRFKSPERNNYEFQLGSGVYANVKPVVDHVDLIAGDVDRAASSRARRAMHATPTRRPAWSSASRASDWARDADGY
jgi:hypothetical protein